MELSKPRDSATESRRHKSKRVVHPLASGERQLALQLWASFWASLHFLNWYSGWSQSSPCPSSAASKCRPVATDAISILRGLMHTHAHSWGNHMGPSTKKPAESFFPSYLCLTQVLSPCQCYVSCTYVSACLIGKSCACVHVALLKSQKTLLVNTAGSGSSNLVFSDFPVLFTCLCPAADEWHPSPSLFFIFLFLAGASILWFLNKVLVFSQGEGFTWLNGYG